MKDQIEEVKKKMFECDICGIETEDPKLFGEKLLCEDCYNELEDAFYGYWRTYMSKRATEGR